MSAKDRQRKRRHRAPGRAPALWDNGKSFSGVAGMRHNSINIFSLTPLNLIRQYPHSMPKKYASSFDNVDEAIRAMGERVITCPECARYFVPWRVDQQRCSTTCSRKFWNRSTTRGSALLPIAMEWRSTRGKAKDKLNKMCFMLDGWNSDDRERNKKYEDAVAVLRERRKKATK